MRNFRAGPVYRSPGTGRETQSIWNYQTVDPGNVTDAVLKPTFAQIGVIDPKSFDQYKASNKPDPRVQYYAATVKDQPRIKNQYRDVKGQTVWDPYGFTPEFSQAPTALGAVTTNVTTGTAQGTLETTEHGPADPARMAEIARIAANPQPKRTWLQRLMLAPMPRMGPRGAFQENIIAAVGRIGPNDPYEGTAAATGVGNAFQIPDVRSIWNDVKDNRGVTQTGIKAGRPTTDPAHEPMATRVQNGYDPVHAEGTTMDTRIRAGAAEPLQGRPASMPHWFYYRPFDKLMADHLTGQKGVARAPLVSRPIMTKSELNNIPGGLSGPAGGPSFQTPAPGMTAFGTTPNTDRQTPTPWDEQLVSTDPSAIKHNRRFGLR